MKTLEEIKKEFYEDFAKPFPYGNITDGRFEYIWDSSKPSPDTIWKFIQSTISQTKQELIEEIKNLFDEYNEMDDKSIKFELRIQKVKQFMNDLQKLSNK